MTATTHPRTARTVAKVVFVTALAVHLALLVHGGSDPHKRFGFRPFNESDVWSAQIVRVHADGSRHPVDDGTWAYDWDELVGVAALQGIAGPGHADGGARSSVDLLDRALTWALDHIPADHETVALEATVTVVHNGHEPYVVLLTSEDGAQ